MWGGEQHLLTPHLRPRFFSFVLPVCLFVEGTPNASILSLGRGRLRSAAPAAGPRPPYPRWSSCRTDTPARAAGQQGGARPRHVLSGHLRPPAAVQARAASSALTPLGHQLQDRQRASGELMRELSLSARTEGPAHQGELSPGPPLRLRVASGTPGAPTARQPFPCCTSGAPAQTCPSFRNSWALLTAVRGSRLQHGRGVWPGGAVLPCPVREAEGSPSPGHPESGGGPASPFHRLDAGHTGG